MGFFFGPFARYVCPHLSHLPPTTDNWPTTFFFLSFFDKGVGCCISGEWKKRGGQWTPLTGKNHFHFGEHWLSARIISEKNVKSERDAFHKNSSNWRGNDEWYWSGGDERIFSFKGFKYFWKWLFKVLSKP